MLLLMDFYGVYSLSEVTENEAGEFYFTKIFCQKKDVLGTA